MQEQEEWGPQTDFAKETDSSKYCGKGETFRESCTRVANALSDDSEHFEEFRDILLSQRFLTGGRIRAAAGSPRTATCYNCHVSGDIEDSLDSIMEKAREAALTMKAGAGIGYDFSTLRPYKDFIRTLDSNSSGPVSFMDIFDTVCGTIASAGNRRGAQMGVLRVDHPDIEYFITAKANRHRLTRFNVSVWITDEFMEAVKYDTPFDLKFEGRVYETINAVALFDKIMRANWDWGEPGLLFGNRINRLNNLAFCETLSSTNPCGEQPLPPYGACLLGSFNLTKYIDEVIRAVPEHNYYTFDWEGFTDDIDPVIRAMDNVVDVSSYALPQQEIEAKLKRRMGIGITGFANTSEVLGYEYGSNDSLGFLNNVLHTLANGAYRASANIAARKGMAPIFKRGNYHQKIFESNFVGKLDDEVRELIHKHGLRNSHLISIAPTGTISITADNVSSGIEPPFHHTYNRTVQTIDGPVVHPVIDYAVWKWGVFGKTADMVTADEHLAVLASAQYWVDSAVSKTLNLPEDISWEEFKGVYMKAYDMGCKGCTTFREGNKRGAILQKEDDDEGSACYIDRLSGERSCE